MTLRLDPEWIAIRSQGAARALRSAVSASELSFERPGFGWLVQPAPGSILASPRGAHWDPEPDYFHHWVRDAAIALHAVPAAIAAQPETAHFWLSALKDHIRFSRAISDPERQGPDTNPLRASAQPEYEKFLRPDTEMRELHGDSWMSEPRCAADGAPDCERWNRPQDDGPALRASAMIGLFEAFPDLESSQAVALVERDLSYVARVAGRPCIGPWEEEPPRRTTFTLIAQWDALDRGANWLARRGQTTTGYRTKAKRLEQLLQDAADPKTGSWRESIEAAPGQLDAATILAILHARRHAGPVAMSGPRTRATIAALEDTFARLYPFNNGRVVPAIGRWAGDAYFGGNPWYPITLGFAELHYCVAAECSDDPAFDKAEAWMAMIQEVAPDGDDLPEQFHRVTGVPESCPALTWSSAAFLRAANARAKAVQALACR